MLCALYKDFIKNPLVYVMSGLPVCNMCMHARGHMPNIKLLQTIYSPYIYIYIPWQVGELQG